jgi:hypothetical protein
MEPAAEILKTQVEEKKVPQLPTGCWCGKRSEGGELLGDPYRVLDPLFPLSRIRIKGRILRQGSNAYWYKKKKGKEISKANIFNTSASETVVELTRLVFDLGQSC